MIDQPVMIRQLLLLTVICFTSNSSYSQINTIKIIDASTAAIDKSSNLLCFRYSDTVHTSNQYTIREIIFFYQSRKSPDTLKVVEYFRDSGAIYPLEKRFYYIKGKPIKQIVLRANPVGEMAETHIYFVNKSEVIQGPKIPDMPGWSHKKSSEHMYSVYKRFIKGYSNRPLPSCR